MPRKLDSHDASPISRESRMAATPTFLEELARWEAAAEEVFQSYFLKSNCREWWVLCVWHTT
jgi:hypothetical protein